MANISKIKIDENTTFDVKDNNAIENITRNGTTFTATKRDGSTFTFNQQAYTNASLGQGYGTAGTEANGVIPVTLASYALSVGGIVAVKFSANVNGGVSLNINSTGAKPIYHKGVSIESNVIRNGDIALFIYDGTRYHLLDIDQIRNLAVDSITLQNVGVVGGTSTNITPTGMQVGSAMRGNSYGSNGIEVGVSFGNSVSISNAELSYLDGATSNIQEQLDDNHNSTTALLNQLSAKNLLKYPYYQSNITNNGVTFTVHSDGTITTSGTASASATANLLLHTRIEGETNDFVLKNGRYLVNGCASGGASNKWFIGYQYTNKNNQFAVLAFDYGNGDAELILNGDYYSDDEVNIQVVVAIASGVNADGLVFKPMIRLASIADSTFEPYAQTNVELTAEKMDVENIAPIEKGNSASKAYAVGDYMIWKRRFYKVTASISSGGAITEETNVTRTTIGAELKAVLNA